MDDESANAGAVKTETKRSARQYMNRKVRCCVSWVGVFWVCTNVALVVVYRCGAKHQGLVSPAMFTERVQQAAACRTNRAACAARLVTIV